MQALRPITIADQRSNKEENHGKGVVSKFAAAQLGAWLARPQALRQNR